MNSAILAVSGLFLFQADSAIKPGLHTRSVEHEDVKREYLVHVPKNYDAKKATPVVLVLHGATMSGWIMTLFTGLPATGDRHNFISVYPNGQFATWNAGGFPGGLVKRKVDDVGYLRKVLDDVDSILNVDKKRVYATGMSNGGMMCYRLASEMSDRIAAIAPVAGTLALKKVDCKHPMPLLHIHGTKDFLVPFNGPANDSKFFLFESVEGSLEPFLKLNDCGKAETTELMCKNEKLKILRTRHPGKDGCDVVLYKIEGGGHVWPGRGTNPAFLGAVPLDLDANEIIWEFFKKHSLR